MVGGKRIGAVVLAGGQGRRMQSKIQKQYMLLAGHPLVTYALRAFGQSEADDIVLVVGPGEEEYARREILMPMGMDKACLVVPGGKERYDSVYGGLKALTGCEFVLIHDGARPLVTADVISRAVWGAIRYQACVVGMPVKDTIKAAGPDGYAQATLDRSRLWQVQTPQAFSYSLIRGAYDILMAEGHSREGITDDAMVVETCTSRKVRLVEGSYENLKVTTPEDLILAEAFLNHRFRQAPAPIHSAERDF